MTRAARLLRGEGLDASSASVIEAVRLAEALAALRDLPMPGLDELNEATLTVLCDGDDAPHAPDPRASWRSARRLGAVPPRRPPCRSSAIWRRSSAACGSQADDRDQDAGPRSAQRQRPRAQPGCSTGCACSASPGASRTQPSDKRHLPRGLARSSGSPSSPSR